ncbi:MAG: Rieske 2Fe-2S domain-containing protein [Planctomycetes bacterium]|nr:Rieske 2Fe-2S domain-containing protein [Planctomycetota bacterium]
MSERHRIAAVADVPVGTGREFVAGGRIVALFHLDDGFHALDGICPHAGGPLAQGVVQGHIVTCPWHGWQFDVTSGQHCLNRRLCQTLFPVTVEGTDVFVDLP